MSWVIALLVVGCILLALLFIRSGRRRHPSDDNTPQMAASMAELKMSVDVLRNQQEQLQRQQQQFLQPLLELAQVKTSVQTVSSLNARLQQDLVTIEQRLNERLRTIAQDAQQRDEKEGALLSSIANVLARTVRKGQAGEDIVRESLRSLPPMFLITNQTVKGGVVEFAIKLTDDRIMPLDSKWVASDLLNQYATEQDERRREETRRTIEERVLRHAKEVAKYLDPTVTTDIALCAIPDAAHELLKKAVTQAFQDGVLIVPYSQVLPIALVFLHLFRRYAGSHDLEDTRQCLGQIRLTLQEMQTVLDNNFQKGSTMIENAIDAYRQLLSGLRTSLAMVERAQTSSSVAAGQELVGGAV